MNNMADRPGTEEAMSPAYAVPVRKRSESVQRLQIGLAGIGSMVLLIGLASVIMERAQLTEEGAVPDAAATVAADAPPIKNDPLAEAGVVPDMPSQGDAAPAQEQAIVPEQGNAQPAQ